MNVLTGRGRPAATRCRWTLALAGALLGAVAFAVPAGAAETVTEVEKIVPDSGFCNPTAWEPPCFASELGISVPVDDETLMAAATIGYLNDDDVYQFRVFAYGREAGGRWAPPQALGGYRGWEVGRPDLLQIDVDAARAMIGNPHWSDLPHGYVYAFGRDDAGFWSWTDTLRDPEKDYWFAFFGFDIDLRGNTAVIDGKLFEADDGDWAFAQTLDPSLPASWSQPHDRADFDGQTIVTAGPDYGVQLWERDPAGAWVVQQAIPEPGGPGEAGFGEAVPVDGDVLLVGAPGTDGPGEAAGAVLVYLRGNDGTDLDPRESNSRGSPTVAIDPVAAWYGPLSSGDDPAWRGTPRGSRWVSYVPSGSGGSYPSNNTIVTFFDEFEVSGQPVAGTLRVLADDSAAVLLNGRVLFPEATRKQNYPTCSAFPIGCLENTMGILDLTGFLEPGEWVDVPFTVCLKRRVPFRLLVDVLGSTRVAAPAPSVE